jgi:hypothetical protein
MTPANTTLGANYAIGAVYFFTWHAAAARYESQQKASNQKSFP